MLRIDTLLRTGQLVLFHSGCTTPYTQIDDTHLHAQLHDTLQKLENPMAHSQQQKAFDEGMRLTTSMSRPDTYVCVSPCSQLDWT